MHSRFSGDGVSKRFIGYLQPSATLVAVGVVAIWFFSMYIFWL